jgi:hypothetical protein
MDPQERLSLEQELLDLLKKRQGIEKDTLEDSRDFANVLQSQVREIKEQVIQRNKLNSISRSIVKQSEELYSIHEDELGTSKSLNDLAKKRQDLEKIQIQLSSFLGTIKTGNAKTDVDINKSIKDQILNTQKLLKETKEVENTSNKIANSFGVKTFGAISDITKKIPGLNRFSKPFEDAAEAARKQALINNDSLILQSGKGLTKEKIKQLGFEKELNGLTGKAAANKAKSLGLEIKTSNTFLAGIKSIGPSLAKAFGPAAIILELVQAFFKLDSLAGDTAKSMGISYSQATQLNSEFNSIANRSNNIFVTTKGINESFNQINTALGTNGKLSEELLVTQTELVKQAFYSVEAATMLSKLSLATGKPAKEITTQFLGQAKALNLVNGTAINEKQLLESISKVSKATLATFAAQPGKLAEAAYEAKKLGLELNQIEAIQSSLLDIESSIAAEFEAEVITGKQLNLERARYFALTNDLAGLSKELSDQGITQAQFSKMTVIEQEAIAKAMGMSKDIMGGMLMEQAAISALSSIDGKNAKEKYDNAVKLYGVEKANQMLGDDTLAQQMQSASIQERLVQTVEKLKEAFVSIAEPLMNIISPIVNILSPVLSGISQIVGYIVEGFKTLLPVLVPIAGILAVMYARTIALAIASAAKSAFQALGGIPIVGPALALAAIGYAASKIKQDSKPQSVGDISSPASGKTQVSTKEGGLFELSKNDDLVAAPGLINKLNTPSQPLIINQSSQQQTTSIDYDKMALAMSRVQVQTNLDGVRVSSELQKAPLGIWLQEKYN